MSWQEIYKSKLVSPEEAVSLVAPGENVFYSFAGSGPIGLVNALSKKLPDLKKINFITALAVYPYEYLFKPEYQEYFQHYSMFYFFSERLCPNKANLNLFSTHFSQSPYVLEQIRLDVMLCECPPPDEDGYLNYGPYGTCINEVVARQASKIIVQVNNKTPVICGNNNRIHVSKVDRIIEQDHELVQIPPIEVTEVETAIARYVVDRIEDGSTIQIGVGGLANAICSFLESKQDLGIHSEFFVDEMMPLIKKGIINGSKKNINPGEATVSFGGTSIPVYDFLHKNPAVKMYPVSYINDPNIIGKHDNFVSVNNALTVDLTGQVGSESIGPRQFSGTGGQLDFIRGARLSKKGQSFIALPSCTESKNGPLSRIVVNFEPGQIVTTPRSDVDMIVTEFGIAELRYKSLRERAKALIAIAHPQFRDELTTKAKGMGVL